MPPGPARAPGRKGQGVAPVTEHPVREYQEDRMVGSPCHELTAFFDPRSVAVVGASKSEGKAGFRVLANIVEFGFRGNLYPVNPGASEVLGIPSYPSVSSLPEVPDLVIAVLPREKTRDLMLECADAGAGHVIIPAAGFSDVGEEGRRLEEAVMRVAREAGMRVMGPNSIGTISPSSGIATSIVSLERMRPGRVAMFGQTGLFSSGIARAINTSEKFGVSRVACLGNKADVDETDMLDYLREDPETAVICMYTEGVKDGCRFARSLRLAAGRKPVLLVKSGRTEEGRTAVASHTGALSGSDEIFSGLVDQCGAMRVGDFEEMLDLAKAFAMLPRAAGRGVGVVSITGAGCVLSADAVGGLDVELPAVSARFSEKMKQVSPSWVPYRNPADIWAAIEAYGSERSFTAASEAMLEEEAIDSLVVIFTLIPEARMDIAGMFSSLRRRFANKPVAAVLMGGDARMHADWKSSIEEVGVPTYPSPARALAAVAALSPRR